MKQESKRPSLQERLTLAPQQLRWRCDTKQFAFDTTADLEEGPLPIIGQPRAMEALELGLSMHSAGYNIFVVGEVGTGRSTAVRRQLETLSGSGATPPDLCFVHNFRDPDQPRLISLPAGQGASLRRVMSELVEGLGKSLSELFDSENYRARCSGLVEAARARHKERIREFEKQIQQDGFVLVQVQMGPHIQLDVMYLFEGKPIDPDELEPLVEQGRFERAEYERLLKRHAELELVMEGVTQELGRVQRELRGSLLKLDRDLARPRIEAAVAETRRCFADEKLAGYLDEVTTDMLDHLERFRDLQEPVATGTKLDRARAKLREKMLPYAVNVMVDHGQTGGRPILWETSPTYRNLFGTVDRFHDASSEEWRTDHTRIKGGSLARASGGILVLDAMDVLAEPGVWAALKRTLRNRVLEIRAFDPLNLLGTISLKPEPVPIDVKVVLIGTHQIYALLLSLDEDFSKVFKVKADFATDTARSPDELVRYARLVQKLSKSEQLLPFQRDAVASVVEHGVRLAEHRDKLSTRFHEIADVVREADHWARKDGALLVDARHIDQAIERRRHRLDLVEERLREQILQGTLILDTEGSVVGQVNALTVLDTGDHVFSVPARITAVTAVGRLGIVNLERESHLSRAAHTKGLLILGGFLRARFAQDWPLSLSASLCFEQHYGAIDGDSASAAELYALLSSLSGVPLRQDIAVTGSVNQKGQVQPIGAVNEKIEGYFDLCRQRAPGGLHGVMIPARNLPHLQLRKDVVEAVEQGRFCVYAVSTVEEGIEILTGVEAGTRDLIAKYPAGSIFGLVETQLHEFAAAVRAHGTADLRLEA